MKKRIKIQGQSDKVSPYRLKFGRYTVSVHNQYEAKRIQQFIYKILKVHGITYE